MSRREHARWVAIELACAATFLAALWAWYASLSRHDSLVIGGFDGQINVIANGDGKLGVFALRETLGASQAFACTHLYFDSRRSAPPSMSVIEMGRALFRGSAIPTRNSGMPGSTTGSPHLLEVIVGDVAGLQGHPEYRDFAGLGAVAHWNAAHKCEALLLFVPHGYVIVGFALGLVTLIFRHVCVARRFGAGCCEACGYDLRASKERCPECGKPFVTHEQSAKRVELTN